MDEDEPGKVLMNRASFEFNMSAIDKSRSFLTIFAGAATGILGLTGLGGLASFLATYAGISLAILACKMRGDSEAFTEEKPLYFVLGHAGGYGLSFVLFWTLAYALVYIY
ncbi:hypothetical protein M885DRAFT_548438 [Pelagophyceae sp. CCMP2097]|nr:hypothetical protein M885DRAFT_548438 [Pelagophyceae sp. CCMP2097]|mmetsp:Transcript_25891/g.87040  ORF Transcript_25891/g.87040 Transcript_25891/m.87040 type:complete len:110 (-) Transcript_25891:28-357(-)